MRLASARSDHAALSVSSRVSRLAIVSAATLGAAVVMLACARPQPPTPGTLLPPVAVPVAPPSASAIATSAVEKEDGIVVDLLDDGRISFDGAAVEEGQLLAAFAKVPKNATPIFRGSKDVAWGRVVRGLDLMKQSGITSFVLVVAGDRARRTPVIELPKAGRHGIAPPPIAPRPGETRGPELDSMPRTVFVVLTHDGKSFLDGVESVGPLRERLHAALTRGGDPADKAIVIVHADMQAPLGTMIDITRDVRAEGALVAYAVSPAPPAPVASGMMGGVMGDALESPRNSPPPGARPKPKPRAFDACAFPAQALKEGVDEAAVVIRVNVDATGKPTAVTILNDPGHGFGTAATTCARKASFDPAKDVSGKSVAGEAVVRVRFVR